MQNHDSALRQSAFVRWRRQLSRNHFVLVIALAALNSDLSGQTAQDSKDFTIDAAERSKVIDGVIAQINHDYVFPEVAKEMEQAIRLRQTKHRRLNHWNFCHPQRIPTLSNRTPRFWLLEVPFLNR